MTLLLTLPLVLVGCKGKTPTLVDIELSGDYRTVFLQNETFVYDGLVVTALYSNESTAEVTDYEISTPDMSILGEQEVEVTYKEIVKSYTITINEIPHLIGIELSGEYETVFAYEGEFNHDGLVVTAKYDNTATEVVSEYAISSPDMYTLGEQEVVVTYEGFTASYSILIEYRNNPERGYISYTMPASLNETLDYYHIDNLYYHNNYFRHSATILDDDLKLLSFASAVVSDKVERAASFFESMYFDNFHWHDYDEITEDTIGYFFAHKNIDDFELYAVSVRGFEYQAEWANNFKIGTEDDANGDHYGFSLRATELYEDLVGYINTLHQVDKTVKIWISGYSRAGAISDFVSMKIMNSNDYSVNENTLYTYTFEAPASIYKDNKVAYPNVFNFYNSADLIPYIPPQKYDLYRTGTDISIYDENVETIVANFDPAIVLPTFTAKEGKFSNDQEFIAHVLDGMLEETGNAGSMGTRQAYVDNYQDDLAYIVALLFTLPPETNEKVMAAMKDLGFTDVISLIAGGNPFYSKVKAVLDEDGVPYDDEKLKNGTAKIGLFVSKHLGFVGEFVDIWSMGIDEEMSANLSRAITMHYPEITYSLISSKHFAA